MHYEINISLHGKHFFATAERSIDCIADLARVLPTIVNKFPEEEGYKVEVTKIEKRGERVNVTDVLKGPNTSSN